MRSWERVQCAINLGKPDRVPKGEIFVDEQVVKGMMACDNVGFEELYKFAGLLALDIHCIGPAFPLGNNIPGANEAVFLDLKRWSAETDLFTFAMLDGVFGWGVRLLGFEKFMLAIVRDTLDYHDVLERVERLNRGLAQRAREEGAHGILIADDIAYQRGTLVNPATLRESYFPNLGKLVNHLRSESIPVLFHSDGNLNDVIPDLINAGINGVQCLEKNAGMDIKKIKDTYGRDICLWGNLDISELIRPLPRDELKKMVQELEEEIGHNGGYILGTSSGLIDGIDYNAVKAVYC